MLTSILMPSTHARDFPHHAAVAAWPSDHRCAVEIAVRVERRGAIRGRAVTTAEVVEIDHTARFAAIGQLVDPAIPISAAYPTRPKKITGGVNGYATAGAAGRAEGVKRRVGEPSA